MHTQPLFPILCWVVSKWTVDRASVISVNDCMNKLLEWCEMSVVCQTPTRATLLRSAYHHNKSNENRFSTVKRHQIRILHAKSIKCVSQFRKCTLGGDNYMCNVFGVDVLNMPIYLVAKKWNSCRSYMWYLTSLSYSPDCMIWSGSKISWWESFSMVFFSNWPFLLTTTIYL